MTRLLAFTLVLALANCMSDPATQTHVHAADVLTKRSADHFKAYAAGDDCMVLLIRADTALDDPAVETMHYGAGDAADGGLRRFAENHQFRAVAYEDAAERLWTYGSITRMEAQSMAACR